MSEQEKRRDINWTITYLVLPVISLGLLVAAYFVPKDTLRARLVEEMGIAGAVAFVLAFTIERLSNNESRRRAETERDLLREEFRELAKEERAAIKKDVFYQTYGRMIPLDIREELDHHVLQADFIRAELFLTFNLTIVKDPKTLDEYVKSDCTSNSQIKNLCGKTKPFPLSHSIDPSPSEALADEVKYLELQSSGSEAAFLLRESDLKAMTSRDGGQVSLVLPQANQVVVLPDSPTGLKIQYQGIRILEGGGIYFFFTTHTCALDLTVHVINNDLKISADAYSPHQLTPTERHNAGSGYYNWTIKKPLLAYQAIHVTWRRPVAPASQPAPMPPSPAPQPNAD